ncbi:MAG TPA: hypothetical protein VK735_38965 [Pseudonocardia sp.]|nr:hypothetical protein [Pseudonocardia sp.]HTF53462.1 hypothetical protein [Pseudonocardia sp.]
MVWATRAELAAAARSGRLGTAGTERLRAAQTLQGLRELHLVCAAVV